MARKALKRGSHWAWIALALALGATIGASLASWGSIQGWWSVEAGLASLPYCFGLAVIGALAGLFARFRRRDGQLIAVAAVLIGVGLAGYLAGEWWQAGRYPAIHDVTTNLDDPPVFAAIQLRDDLRSGVPMLDRPGHERLTVEEHWKAVHTDAYGALRSLPLALTPAQAIAKARAVAERHRWRVVRADERAGSLEAISATRFFGLTDDIAVRARPAPGGGSIVDVRSVSRQGIGDQGRGKRNIERMLDGLRS